EAPEPAPFPVAKAELHAFLQACIAAGDTATLLALERGDDTALLAWQRDRSLPAAASPAPSDFTSDQPGGRGVPGPIPLLARHPVVEADFHANGVGDEDGPQG